MPPQQCLSQQLGMAADTLLANKGWTWPPGRLGPRAFIEDELVPAVCAEFSRLHPRLSALIHERLVIRAARLKSPNAHVERHEDGILVFVNGGLFLLFYDYFGYAFELIKQEISKSGGLLRIKGHVNLPSRQNVLAVAGVLRMFLDDSTAVTPHLMPAVKLSSSALPSVPGLVSMALQFAIAHEIGHALRLMGAIQEAPGIRELVLTQHLASEQTENWIDELSADACAVSFLLRTMQEHEAAMVTAAAACLMSLELFEVLEWLMFLPSSTPYPLDPNQLPSLQIFYSHPPVDLRRHVVVADIGSNYPDLIKRVEPYQLAARFLLDRLHADSHGGCVAPLEPSTAALCSQQRAGLGWYCEHHIPRSS